MGKGKNSNPEGGRYSLVQGERVRPIQAILNNKGGRGPLQKNRNSSVEKTSCPGTRRKARGGRPKKLWIRGEESDKVPGAESAV